jgi:hypothetical protein
MEDYRSVIELVSRSTAAEGITKMEEVLEQLSISQEIGKDFALSLMTGHPGRSLNARPESLFWAIELNLAYDGSYVSIGAEISRGNTSIEGLTAKLYAFVRSASVSV